MTDDDDAALTALRALPKAELHLHFAGTIQADLLRELARRHRIPLPADTTEGLREWLRFRDFDHFADVYHTINRCLAGEEDFELVTCDLARQLAAQNVRYAEVNVGPARYENAGIPWAAYFGAMTRGRERARATFGVDLRWIFSIFRSVADERLRRYWADYTTEVAIAGREDGVVGLGLGGAEDGYPPAPFAPWFERARCAGLRSAPHAGEHAGPESVRAAVEALGADRIAHGVRAIEDSSVVAMLATRGVVLDVCPTSNVRLGVYASIRDHPMRRLHMAGVSVTVSTDDPALFGVTLDEEVAGLVTNLRFDPAEAATVVANAFRHRFSEDPLPSPAPSAGWSDRAR
jgi:aminodeoxyfutalosine deaminase